jgi:hypothetical protein
MMTFNNLLQNKLAINFSLGLMGLIGILLILCGTSKFGVGISPDSVSYISTARNLIIGKGFRIYDGGYYVFWPPLFPLSLSTAGLTGIDPLHAARIINAVAFGLIIFFSGQLFLRSFKSRVMVIVGAFFVLFSVPLHKVSVMAWSEPLYTLFSIIFFIAFTKFSVRKSYTWLLLSATFASLALLQRYAGITIAITAIVTIVFLVKNMPAKSRITYALTFCVLSLAPLMLWITRNYLLTSTFSGHRPPAYYGLLKNISLTADVIGNWFLPVFIHPMLPLFILTVFCIVFLLIGFFAHKAEIKPAGVLPNQIMASIIVYITCYIVFFIITSSLIAYEPINDRQLAPLFPFVLLVLLVAAEESIKRSGFILENKKLIRGMLIALLPLLMTYPVLKTSLLISDWIKEGAGEDFYGLSYYGKKAWQESPLITWLKNNPLSGCVYSNDPAPLYILAGIHAKLSLSKDTTVTRFREELNVNQNCCLVWFNNNLDGRYRMLQSQDRICPLEKVKELIELQEVAVFSDGTVYRFKNL